MRRYQEVRYEKLGLALFARVSGYSLEKAQVIISLADEKERIAMGGEPPSGWGSSEALTAIDRVLQGLRRGDYEVVMPTLAEKNQIRKDGIALHKSVMELVICCLNRSAAFAYTAPYKWSNLGDSFTNEICYIVKMD